MAESVGGIYYDIDARTEGLIEGQRQVKASTAAIGKDLDKLGQSAGEAGKQMSAAGADAKKMASGVSEAARATTDAIGSYNKMSNELQKQRDAVASYIESLKRQNETLGMSATELAQYEAARLGATEKDKQVVANLRAQIDQYNENQNAIKKNQAAMAALEAEQEENRATVRGLIANLEEYKNTLGMTNRELVLYKAAQSGATDADLRAIRTQLDLIDAKKASINSGMALSKTSQGVTNALGGVGRSAGQAGIQIQQFVGQIQGGVSPMVALAQQGADLGFALGAPLLGAVVGISAAIAGMLIPSLFDSTNATEALEKAMINLDKVVTKTDDGVLVLSEEIRELAKVSEAAARARIATAMLDVQDALKQAGAAAVDTFDTLDAGFGLSTIGDYTNRVRYAHDNTEGFLKTSMELGKELGYTGQQAQQAGKDMLITLSQVANAPTPEAFNRLQEQIAASVNDGKASDGIKRLYNDLAGIIAQANSAAEAQEMLNKALSNFPEFLAQSQSAAAGFKTQMDGLLSSIKAQADTAGMTAKQVAIYTAEQLAAKDSTIDLNKALAEIDQYFERIEAQELLTQRTREQQQAIAQAKTAWDNYAKSIETQSAKAESAEASNALMIQRIRETGAAAGKSAAEIQALVDAQQRLLEQQQQQEADKAKQKVGSDVRFAGVTDQQAELTRLADSYMQQQLLLQTALEMELITRQEYADRKLLLEQQTQEQINQINQQGTASLKEQLDSVGFNLDTFQNQAIGAFAAVATGAMSGEDAIRGLAQSILTTAIGALIKMAVTAAIGQKAATATGAATAAALSASYATPAALASLASFGGNAVPAQAGIASTVALTQGLAIGGGRLNGGPVRPGMIYPVTEDGRPELLMSGGKQYLLPGSRGEVVSNKDMGRAGGSNVTVNVINNASGTKIEEKRSQGPDGAQMIEIIVADIQQRGKVHNTITNTTTAGNRI